MRSILVALTLLLGSAQQSSELRITMVGNAGVLLSDGTTSLLVDLPYESGASGYMRYDPSALQPPGAVVSVITHHHRDHLDPGLFLRRDGWQVVGPRSVTDGLPGDRVIRGDSLTIGEFEIVTIPTPHTDDHRSYRIRWRGRVLHFVGDTEDPGHLMSGPDIDLLFVTPWLSCAASDLGLPNPATRSIAYHLNPAGGDRICGEVEVLEQGTSFGLSG